MWTAKDLNPLCLGLLFMALAWDGLSLEDEGGPVTRGHTSQLAVSGGEGSGEWLRRDFLFRIPLGHCPFPYYLRRAPGALGPATRLLVRAPMTPSEKP